MDDLAEEFNILVSFDFLLQSAQLLINGCKFSDAVDEFLILRQVVENCLLVMLLLLFQKKGHARFSDQEFHLPLLGLQVGDLVSRPGARLFELPDFCRDFTQFLQ